MQKKHGKLKVLKSESKKEKKELQPMPTNCSHPQDATFSMTRMQCDMANPDGKTEARGDDCNLELNQVKRQPCCSENKAKPRVKSPNKQNQGSEKNQRPRDATDMFMSTRMQCSEMSRDNADTKNIQTRMHCTVCVAT